MIDWNQWLVVIPARIHSTRLPRKPLADLAGMPLIIRVYERLIPLVNQGAKVLVATDDASVEQTCDRYQVPCTLTLATHPSGTDRCAEVAAKELAPFVLNVQGDEPFIALDDIENLARAMQNHQAAMGTLVHKNFNLADYENPNCVKAVLNSKGEAIYFSRSPIPYFRSPATFQWFWQHIGVYAYAREFLLDFCRMSPHMLESHESLEQLRAIGYGIPILVSEARHPSIGIDTPADLEAARARFQ